MATVFLSHSSADNAEARRIAAALADHGFQSLFLDIDPIRGIPAGTHWEQVLYAKLLAARAVIALHSENWRV